MLSDAERDDALKAHPDWCYSTEHGGRISRTFRFRDFEAAFAFMTAMARFSESMDHHPEWRNVYNRVDVDLTTHDAGGVTKKDIAWAHEADGLFSRMAARGNQDS